MRAVMKSGLLVVVLIAGIGFIYPAYSAMRWTRRLKLAAAGADRLVQWVVSLRSVDA
jgi:hypothetical protein